MSVRKLTILASAGMIVAASVLGCVQSEGKIIPPAPNTLPEGAKLTVAVGGAGPAKTMPAKPASKPAEATKPDGGKKDDAKKDDAKKDDKTGDDKKPDPNKDKPVKP